MATLAMNSVQALPRFLLPRLSWQTALANRQTIRALSTITTSYASSTGQPNLSVNRPTNRTSQNVITPSRSSILYNPAHHQAFHATAQQSRDHHFDTLKFVQRLQEEGFTEVQAVAMMKVLSDVIEERLVAHPFLADFH